MGACRPACHADQHAFRVPRSAQSSAESRRANASKRDDPRPRRRGWGIRSRSQSAAHPRIPISHPLPRRPSLPLSVRPSLLPVRANRFRCGAAVAHLSCVIVSRSVCPSLHCPDPLCPPIPNSQCFSLCSSPFPGRLCTYPTILSSRLWAGRRVGGGELTSESSDTAGEKEGIWTMKEHRSLLFQHSLRQFNPVLAPRSDFSSLSAESYEVK